MNSAAANQAKAKELQQAIEAADANGHHHAAARLAEEFKALLRADREN